MQANSMKAAVLSDVHGNLPALKAVLADCARQGAEQIWYLGDFVGYIPFPNEVIERLRREKAISIVGNYDLKVLSYAKNARRWKKEKAAEKVVAFEWNCRALSAANKRYLGALPREMRIEAAGMRVLMVHGSPADIEEGIGPMTPPQRLKELALMAKADIVLSGHTHRPLEVRAGNVLFVNPGSVGRPEGDTRASYAILTLESKHVTVTFRKVKYPVEEAVRAIHKAVLPKEFGDVVREGANLVALKLKGGKRVAAQSEEKRLAAVTALARRCSYEREHTHQVEKTSMKIFDQLKEMHGLGNKERFLLRCGALLHDIGWVEGQQGHHKTAMRIIMESTDLPFDFRDKSIIALVARYHRKAMPVAGHAYYCDLSGDDQGLVRKLAAILRVADGLDRTHRSLVRDIECEVSRSRVLATCTAEGPLAEEFAAAAEKADLFEAIFGRHVIFRRKRA